MNSKDEIYRLSKTFREKRSTKISDSVHKADWITTFADMVTLILTFLVLIISVTTLDPSVDIQYSAESMDDVVREERLEIRSGNGVLLFSNRGLMAPIVDILNQIDNLPSDLLFDQHEIKNAIFQLESIKTIEYEELSQALDENIEIFKDERGLVLRWDRSLLFDEGESALQPEHLMLLDKLAIFLKNIILPISIEGYTNPFSELEGGFGPKSYELSFQRATAVMKHLRSLGLNENRMRIAGFGGDKNRSNELDTSWENSRLELVIYKPRP